MFTTELFHSQFANCQERSSLQRGNCCSNPIKDFRCHFPVQQQNNWHNWHIDIWRSKPHNFIKCVDEHGWTMVMYTLHPSRFKPTTWVVPFVISWGWFLCLLRDIIIKTPFPTGPCLLFLSLKALYLCQDSLLLQKPCDLVSLQTGDQSWTNQKKIGYCTHGSP